MFKQPEVTTLSPDETTKYLELQRKVGWRKAGTLVFESGFPIHPYVSCEIAIVRRMLDTDCIFMWFREDAHYRGWHMPGGYLIRGESHEEWIRRVLAKETAFTLRSYHEIRTFSARPSTGWVPNHQMAHFFLCDVDGDSPEGNFFPLTKLPDNTLEHHRKYVEYLRAHLLRINVMREGGVYFDYCQQAPEWQWRIARGGFAAQDTLFQAIRDYQTFDAALAALQSYSDGVGVPFILFDDQGLEVLSVR
ncbi:MAG: NUDIX domain-containing protein [Patescibacteria group bacterium]